MNKVILMGRLGKDPEIRNTQSGMAICSISVCTTDGYGDKQKASWHAVKAFGKLAEVASQYLTKGRQVLVEGRISYNEYEKEGKKSYFTEIIADKIEFVGGGTKDDSKKDNDQSHGEHQSQSSNNMPENIEPSFSFNEEIPF